MPSFNDNLKDTPFFNDLTNEQKRIVETLIADERFINKMIENMDWNTIVDAGLIAIITVIDTLEKSPESNKLSKTVLNGPLQYLLGVMLALGMKPFTSDPVIFAERMNYILEDPKAHLAMFTRKMST